MNSSACTFQLQQDYTIPSKFHATSNEVEHASTCRIYPACRRISWCWNMLDVLEELCQREVITAAVDLWETWRNHPWGPPCSGESDTSQSTDAAASHLSPPNRYAPVITSRTELKSHFFLDCQWLLVRLLLSRLDLRLWLTDYLKSYSILIYLLYYYMLLLCSQRRFDMDEQGDKLSVCQRFIVSNGMFALRVIFDLKALTKKLNSLIFPVIFFWLIYLCIYHYLPSIHDQSIHLFINSQVSIDKQLLLAQRFAETNRKNPSLQRQQNTCIPGCWINPIPWLWEQELYHT